MVANLINDSGNAVKNQFVIMEGSTIAFQSYSSRVCEIVRPCGMGYDELVRFGRDWDYSQTTSKHLYSFLRQNGLEILASKQAIEEAIKRGHARHDEAIAVIYDESMR
jgi:hypothetical protein